jgi:hypothetical protein
MRSATYVTRVQHAARMQRREIPLSKAFHTYCAGTDRRTAPATSHGGDIATDDAGGWVSAGSLSSTQSACDSSANLSMFH